MKSFKDYLTESKKTYAFKIKVAGKLEDGFAEDLRAAVSKFSVANLSKGKTSPIQENQTDFPQLKNESVTVFDLEIHYPTIPPVLEQYISDMCGCPKTHLIVRGANEAAVNHQEAENFKEANAKPLIGQCDPAPADNQDLVGEKQKMSMLKDLIKSKHMGEEYKGVNDAILAKSLPSEKASEMPEGTTISPLGSKQNKLPQATTAAGLKGK